MKRLALLAALVPGAAHAHAFSTGRDAYGAFLEGAGVILATPGLILPLAALAVTLALWKADGMMAAWPAFLIGQVAGMALAPLVGPWIALVPLAFGLVLGGLAAVAPLGRLGPALPVLAGLMGGVVMAASLEGHTVTEIGVAIRLGLFVAANIATAAIAGLARSMLERWDGEVTRIGWRVAASWIAAILVLYLAFAMTGATA
ncbi:hypothetical protein [Maritimibacter sp. UBA3975]|uniref:hypothetical protein n=1 Tax=Maritimibacter sp. UBA3975 TaxID=1946833 RepID=UPI000C09CAAF|nr:hypothetical protein [Maritimibacter sp. UBA3975]MAM60159.1 hypothetical protein [Maritimibacter sp.]